MKNKFILVIVSIIYIKTNLFGQASTVPNTWVTPTDFLGWNTTLGSPPLYIKTELPQPINFYTNTGAGIIPITPVLQIDATGLVGIGTATIPPTFQLDVTNAININTSTFTAATTYYMINGITILQNLGINNIFVGEGAGNLNIANLTGRGNACLGTNAGTGLQDGWQNIFIGTNAGNSTTDGDFNIMIGNTTGQNNIDGRANTFVGTRSGE